MGVPAVKVGRKYQVVIPEAVRNVVGLRTGDLVQATVGSDGESIVLRRKVLVDYDPELERQLEESEAAVRDGRVLGPFKSAGAAMKALKANARRAHGTLRK